MASTMRRLKSWANRIPFRPFSGSVIPAQAGVQRDVSAKAARMTSVRGCRALPARAGMTATRPGRLRRRFHLSHVVLLLALATLAGCGVIAEQKPGHLAVRTAHVSALGGTAVLELGLDCQLTGPMQDALDHGIPLTLQIELRAGGWLSKTRATRRVELRYYPLSRRYQLRELGVDDVRSFANPASLVAALGSLRLDLPAAFAHLPRATPLRVSAGLDPGALPGALRLPALFEPAWKLAAKDVTWPSAAP